MTMSAYSNNQFDSAVGTRAPTPAAKPKAAREPNVAPVPVPDANAKFEYGVRAPERIVVGSGVSHQGKTILARPVSTGSKQVSPNKPRLVTNPR